MLLVLFGLLTVLPARAEQPDTLIQQLYQTFLTLYNQPEHNNKFYKTGLELADRYRQQGKKTEYYKVLMNICLYDTEHDRPLEAMKRANSMMEEMKEEHFDAYSMVYTVIGTIYESRGNYRMALHYYDESILNLNSEDRSAKLSLYSRLAYLQMFHHPVDAEYWNKKYYDESAQFPAYRQVNLFIQGMINFTLNNKRDFMKAHAEYLDYHAKHPELDQYGMEALEIAHLAFDGKYDEALTRLSQMKSGDINTISVFNMRILIYKMKGDYEAALKTAMQRAECVDSINSDMLFTNLNEINAQTGLAQAQTHAAKDHDCMFLIIMTLALITIVSLAAGIVRIRKGRQQLSERNEQLYAALAMAEEGEKMKTEFVRSVSHEIRTPLNAINGFNDILNTPGIPISDEERADLLQRIRENVQAITNIVDEMLRVADKESNEFNPKQDKIYCNPFLSTLLYSFREQVSGAIELKYTTRVINRFQLQTNEEGLRKILTELIKNAIKFTKEGYIELHCCQSADEKHIEISLADTGIGITAEQREKIFQGFYKADAFQQGIGLGLTVSKKLAQKLGGDLTLDKDYNKGARFVLTLPL